MSYALRPGETVADGVARTLLIQRQRIRDFAGDSANADPDEFVRKTRVRCKRIRAALRLARPVMGAEAFDAANAWWRAETRRLSDLRDARARTDLLEDVIPELTAAAQAEARRALMLLRRAPESARANSEEAWSRIAAFLRNLDYAVLDIPGAGGAEVIEEALETGYRRARKAMKTATRSGLPADFHEWRKSVKTLMLELRLTRKVRPHGTRLYKGLEALALKLGEMQDIEIALEGIGAAVDVGNFDMLMDELEVLQRSRRQEAVDQGEAQLDADTLGEAEEAGGSDAEKPPEDPASNVLAFPGR